MFFSFYSASLVDAFSFQGKMPDSYSDIFLQMTDLTLIGPLFVQKLLKLLRLLTIFPLSFFYYFNVTYKTGRVYRIPPFDSFLHCVTFFPKIFKCLKRVPLSSFFDILQQNVRLKNPKGHPFLFFFGTMRHFPKGKNPNHFTKFFLVPVGESGFRVLSSMKGTFGCLEAVF